MPENLVLLSAGLDSAVNFLIAREKGGVGAAVTVDYGQKAAQREVERSRALCGRYGVRHIVLAAGWLGEISGGAISDAGIALPRVRREQLGDAAFLEHSMRAVWVPNRNGLLANMGACVAEALGLSRVVMGLNAEEGVSFRDNSPAFVREINRALAYSTLSGVRLGSFTITWNKMEIFHAAMSYDLDFRLIWSCYNGDELMCGRCESCVRLKEAAAGAGAPGKLEGLLAREGPRRSTRSKGRG